MTEVRLDASCKRKAGSIPVSFEYWTALSVAPDASLPSSHRQLQNVAALYCEIVAEHLSESLTQPSNQAIAVYLLKKASPDCSAPP